MAIRLPSHLHRAPCRASCAFYCNMYDSILKCFVARTWCLWIAPPEHKFVTTDNPATLIWSDGSPSTMQRPIGFARRNTMILFPLSKTLFAIGEFEGRGGAQNATPSQVARFNALLCRSAYNQIYAGTDKFRVAVGPSNQTISGRQLADFKDKTRA